MVLRDIINDKVVMTHPDISFAALAGVWETNTYEITDTGLLWIDRKFSIGAENAHKRHQAAIERQRPSEPHACARCGIDGYLASYSKVFQEWLCPSCHTFKLEACR